MHTVAESPTIDLLIPRSVDEKANLTLILRTPAAEEDVRALLQSLELGLAAHATDAVPQGSGNAASASGKHDLTSKTIPASEAMDVVPVGDHTYAVWKTQIHLSRPRARLQRPAIYFTAYLAVNATALKDSNKDDKDYLKSFEPLPANVLQPLQFDPSLSASNIHFSETRITKVAPAPIRTHDDVRPIRGASKRAFPVVPALFTRIRYSALPDAVVASLHLETSQVISGTVNLTQVKLDVSNAHVEALSPLNVPTETHAGDETVVLYKLTRTPQSAESGASGVSVSIEATVTLDRGSVFELDVRWQAQVDLLQIASKPVYKWSRPLSASKELLPAPSTQAGSRPASFDVPQKSPQGEHGIAFNFTAAHTTRPNEEFKLHVQCINRSTRPRRFALVVLQPKKTNSTTRTHHHSSSSSSEKTELIANIFNAPPLEKQRPPDVLDLNPDVRIGPLPPGASYETQMRFRALTTGVLDLGVVRIVDLDTRQSVDVRELPDVVSLEPTEAL